ncbi:hypothetical protein CASFOL_006735 [Castilleja foliolosa]|uniref:S-protein homolog n=1 Tax=Castilleja foliolosa TaxID=1961234 RepID=A0ABD3E9A2_9LAMI
MMKMRKQEMLCFTIGVVLLIISNMNMVAPSDEAKSKPLAKTRVVLQNSIPNENVTIHCWSSENDLGTHNLAPNSIFSWHFRVNIRATTKFVCDILVYGDFFHISVFDGRIGNICQEYCLWKITKDGGPCLMIKGSRHSQDCYY